MSDGPLSGKRLLITRPAHQSQDFVDAVSRRGAEPILGSTIAIAPPDDPYPAHRAIDDLHEFKWIVFTSRNGVDAFFDRLRSLDADARYLGGVRVGAIGARTAQRLNEFGIRADLVPNEYVSEAIGRALIEATHTGDRVLIFRAQEGRDVLPQMLDEAGRSAHAVAAYKTVFDVDPQFAEKVARADVIAFTSASTVRGFLELLGDPTVAVRAARGKMIACIGPITAAAAEESGLHVDVVADVSSTDALLDALERHLLTHYA